MPKFKGGYILLARKFLESELMKNKPPLWSKLCIWMFLKANKNDGYKGLKPGQFETSIPKMREAMTYYIGYRKNTPSVKQIRVIYEAFAKGTTKGTTNGIDKMIDVEPAKGIQGIRITLLNYEEYQDPKNYERHYKKKLKKDHEGHNEDLTKEFCRARLIKKQEEYKKNNKIYKYISPSMINFVIDFIFYIQEKKKKRAPNLTKSHLDNSFDTVISLCRLDGFEFKYVHKVIQWSYSDKFWQDNLFSLSVLRNKSSNDLKKFQNIANKYESSKKGGLNGKSTIQNFTGNDNRESVIPECIPEY